MGSGFHVVIVYRSAADKGEKGRRPKAVENGPVEGENKAESPYPTRKLGDRRCNVKARSGRTLGIIGF